MASYESCHACTPVMAEGYCEGGCYTKCFRCGLAACKECSVICQYLRFGRKRICTSCVEEMGKPPRSKWEALFVVTWLEEASKRKGTVASIFCDHIHQWGCIHCGDPNICSKCMVCKCQRKRGLKYGVDNHERPHQQRERRHPVPVRYPFERIPR